jgi:hypothetical protein
MTNQNEVWNGGKHRKFSRMLLRGARHFYCITTKSLKNTHMNFVIYTYLSLCLSAYPHVTTREQPRGLQWKLITRSLQKFIDTYQISLKFATTSEHLGGELCVFRRVPQTHVTPLSNVNLSVHLNYWAFFPVLLKKPLLKKSVAFSPHTNCTDRATAALSAKLVQTFADRGCHVVSATDLYGR